MMAMRFSIEATTIHGREDMPDQSISAGKIVICIADILLSLFIISRVLDLYSTRLEFILCYAVVPWVALIAYFPTALFLGNSLLTRVVRTFIFVGFILLAVALPDCVVIFAEEQELGIENVIPLRKSLLPLPYVSLLLATICLVRFSPKKIAPKED